MLFKNIFLNRWLDWTIASLVIVFIILIGAVQQYSLEQEYNYSGEDVQNSVKLHRKPQQQNTSTISNIDTSSWKTYRNYGFEFRYPSDWEINQETNGVDIIDTSTKNIPSDNAHFPPSGILVSLQHNKKPAALSIEDFAQDEAGGATIVSTSTVTVAGRSSFQLTIHTLDDPPGESVWTYVPNGTTAVVVILVIFNSDAPNRDEILARYNALLTSFSLRPE
jgi:hypothetical protein